MGTVASLDIPGCEDGDVFKAAFERLHKIDEDYSPFKPTSLVSRFNENKLKKPGPEFQKIVTDCQQWQKATDGYFSAWYGKEFEPSGYVKGWAIDEAAKVIKKAGYKTYCLGIGGDVLAASAGEKIWKVGIQDPRNPKRLLQAVHMSSGAIATSGAYERGAHIINPKTGTTAKAWKSVSIIGPDIISADVLATAAFAMEGAPEFLDGWHEYNYLLVDPKNRQVTNLAA